MLFCEAAMDSLVKLRSRGPLKLALRTKFPSLRMVPLFRLSLAGACRKNIPISVYFNILIDIFPGSLFTEQNKTLKEKKLCRRLEDSVALEGDLLLSKLTVD